MRAPLQLARAKRPREEDYDDDVGSSSASRFVFGSEAKRDKEHGEWRMLCEGDLAMEVGHSSLQGFRVSNEDAHLIAEAPQLEKSHALLCLFDGHAGDGSSEYASTALTGIFAATEDYKAYVESKKKGSKHAKGSIAETDSEQEQELIKKAFAQAMSDLDAALRIVQSKSTTDQSGSTCVCSFVSPSHIYCAWVGDSRCCVGVVGDKTITMSEDHKPETEEERDRICKAGGFVFDNRVDGQLAMSRALGDFHLKSNPDLPAHEQKVTCVPDVMVHTRDASDRLLLICCDGVFDVMSNEEAVESVLARFDALSKPEDTAKLAERLAEELIDEALDEGSYDNISAIVCFLPGMAAGKGKKESKV
jgi:serine/threonine protein phosphatase PrpC